MGGLERIIEIEAEFNSGLLAQQYKQIQEDASGDVCETLVVEYVQLVDSVRDKDILFIKRLTKVSHHVLVTSNLEKEIERILLEKIYRYCHDGIYKIEKGDLRYVSQKSHKKRNLVMNSHLHAYAGQVAYDIFLDSEELDWLECSYKDYMKSADIIKKKDKKYAAYSFEFAGEVADILFNQTSHLHWAKKAFVAYSKAAEFLNSGNIKRKMYDRWHAGRMALFIYEKRKDKEWLRRAKTEMDVFINYAQQKSVSIDDETLQIVYNYRSKVDSYLILDDL